MRVVMERHRGAGATRGPSSPGAGSAGSRATGTRRARRGSALVTALILISTMATLALALMALVQSSAREGRAAQDGLDALYVSEAGIADALFDVASGGTGDLGTEAAPVPFGPSHYWVDTTDQGDGLYTVVSTGVDDRAKTRIEVVARARSSSIYHWAAFGEESLTMSSNAFVDSYDSARGTYGDQLSPGGGSHANEAGDVGSNGDVTLSQNATVFGGAHSGPTDTTTLIGNATVSGSTAPSDAEETLPAIDFPTGPSAGDLTVSGSQKLMPGTYFFDAAYLSPGSTLCVRGPAVLVFDSFEAAAGASFLVNAVDGPVQVYVKSDFVLNSNTTVTSLTGSPADFAFFLDGDNVLDPDETVDLDQVDLDSGARLFGTVYAPNAAIRLESDFELFGALIARRVHLDSNSRVHFDEDLVDSSRDGSAGFETLSWRALPGVTTTRPAAIHDQSVH